MEIGSPEVVAYVEAARAAWPRLDVDVDAFVRHVTQRGQPPALEHAGDAYLAFACVRGSAAAVRELDALLRAAAARAAARVDRSPDFADEVAQTLRLKLLGSVPPKIADYAGRASLRAWLMTSAARAALNLRRRLADDPRARASITSNVVGECGPELEILREQYRAPFEAALREALEALEPEDRAILRLHYVERMTCNKLAALYKTSRSASGRRLDAARVRLVEETRARFCARVSLTPSEYESVVALVRSHIDASAERLLAEPRAT